MRESKRIDALAELFGDLTERVGRIERKLEALETGFNSAMKAMLDWTGGMNAWIDDANEQVKTLGADVKELVQHVEAKFDT